MIYISIIFILDTHYYIRHIEGEKYAKKGGENTQNVIVLRKNVKKIMTAILPNPETDDGGTC